MTWHLSKNIKLINFHTHSDVTVFCGGEKSPGLVGQVHSGDPSGVCSDVSRQLTTEQCIDPNHPVAEASNQHALLLYLVVEAQCRDGETVSTGLDGVQDLKLAMLQAPNVDQARLVSTHQDLRSNTSLILDRH